MAEFVEGTDPGFAKFGEKVVRYAPWMRGMHSLKQGDRPLAKLGMRQFVANNPWFSEYTGIDFSKTGSWGPDYDKWAKTNPLSTGEYGDLMGFNAQLAERQDLDYYGDYLGTLGYGDQAQWAMEDNRLSNLGFLPTTEQFGEHFDAYGEYATTRAAEAEQLELDRAALEQKQSIADMYEVPLEGLVETEDGGWKVDVYNPATGEGQYVIKNGKFIPWREAYAATQEEFDVILEEIDFDPTSAAESLGDLYTSDRIGADQFKSDFNTFWNTDSGSGQTWAELFGDQITINPDTGEPTITGNLTPDEARQVMKAFAEWKGESILAAGGGDPIDDPTSGSVDKLFEGSFGSDAANLVAGLSSSVQSPAQIRENFSAAWASQAAEWEMFQKPGAVARGTEDAGGLGSGVQAAALRAQQTYHSARTAAFQTYYDSAQTQNIEAFKTALDAAKTPAEIGSILAGTRSQLIAGDKMRSDAQNATAETWTNMALAQGQLDYYTALSDNMDSQTLNNLFGMFVGELGLDFNAILNLQHKYTEELMGAYSNPEMLGLIMALLDMSTQTGVYTPPGTGYGLAAGSIDAATNLLANRSTSANAATPGGG